MYDAVVKLSDVIELVLRAEQQKEQLSANTLIQRLLTKLKSPPATSDVKLDGNSGACVRRI